ncbi:MAG TPA: toprim domain-containing protein [Rhizomicrobium sp.]|jgi:hypothetical protein
MMQARYSLDEINARLAGRARELCIHLFGAVQIRGHDIWMQNPLRSDPNWTSFSYNTRSFIWKDFSFEDCAGKGLLSLIAKFATRGEYKAQRDAAGRVVRAGAVSWALDFLGLTGHAPDPAEAAAIAARVKRDQAEAAELRSRARAGAFKLWLDAKPLDGTDPASLYLKSRDIDVTKLPEGIPHALRFHPEIWAANRMGPFPGMVACISREGEPQGFAAAHRTYLACTRGVWAKHCWPDCKTGKQVKGPFAGGSIRLTRGASGKTLKAAPEGEWIQVSEGIEDALTGAIAKPEIRSLAGVSLSNIGGLVLPAQLGGVYILKQNDTDPTTLRQFDQAMDRLCERGFEPAIVRADPRFKDFNDILQGKERAA